MKIKIDFDNEELEKLNGKGTFDEVVSKAHDLLDEAIAIRSDYVTCSIKLDSEKDN